MKFFDNAMSVKKTISACIALFFGGLIFTAQASELENPFVVSLSCIEDDVQVHNRVTGETEEGEPIDMTLLTWAEAKKNTVNGKYMPDSYDLSQIQKLGLGLIRAQSAHMLITERREGFKKIQSSSGGMRTSGYPSGELFYIDGYGFAFGAVKNHFSWWKWEGDSRRDSRGYCVTAADRGGVTYTNKDGEPVSREEILKIGMQCEQAFEAAVASGELTNEGVANDPSVVATTWQGAAVGLATNVLAAISRPLVNDSKSRQRFMNSCALELGYERKN